MAGKKNKDTESKLGFLRVVNVQYVVLLLLAVVIIWRAVSLIFIEGEELRKKVDDKVYFREKVSAPRGNIYSADRSLLAVTVPRYDIAVDFEPGEKEEDRYKYRKLYKKNIHGLCDSLHQMFPEKTARQYFDFFEKGRRRKAGRHYAIFKKDLSYEEKERLLGFPIFNKGRNAGGIIVEDTFQRVKPLGMLAARTLGSMPTGRVEPYVGLEGAYNSWLKGRDGSRLVQKLEKGVLRPIFDASMVEAVNGKDIVTTIDTRIQDVAESALMTCMKLNEAEKGCVVLMEVATGKVVAIANLMQNSKGEYEELLNHAVGEAVEPGSTFKLATAIALMEETGMDTSEVVPTGEMRFYNRTMKDSHKGGWGDVSFKSAFEKSSNVGVSYMANKVFLKQPQKFVDYLSKMHLDRPLGVEIKGEGRPYVKSPKDKSWSGVTIPWMSIGYETMITPLQILCLYNAVANDGKMMKPLFVTEILDEGKVEVSFHPEVLVEKICSQKTLDKVKGMLEGVVENGTAKCLENPLYKVAAKTGTAQVNYARRGQEKMIYRASIVGYFPADRPKYSCIVMISNPQKNRVYGATVAGPVFRDIADKVFATLMKGGQKLEEIPRNGYGPVLASGYGADIEKVYQVLGIRHPDFESSSYLRYRGTGVVGEGSFSEISVMKEVIPDLRGLGLRDAAYLLEKYQLKFSSVGCGKVVRQQPLAGAACAPGQTVYLELE